MVQLTLIRKRVVFVITDIPKRVFDCIPFSSNAKSAHSTDTAGVHHHHHQIESHI